MQQNFYKFYTIYFIIFGIVISLSGLGINYYLQEKDMKNILDRKSKEIFKMKNEDVLAHSIKNMDNILKTLATNQSFSDYFESKRSNKEKELTNIFLTIVNGSDAIIRARFIDKNGQEIIRVDRNSNENSFVVDKSKLQNKYDSEYFKLVSSLKKNTIWHSIFDLNIENGQVEIPYKPTFRVGMPVYYDDKLEGIVIINFLINDLLNIIGNSATFEHYIIDKDSNYIHHPDSNFSFNKYKNIKRNLKEDFPNGLISDGIYTYSLNNILRNEDNSIMILRAKQDHKNEIIGYKFNSLVIIFFFTIALSFIISFLVSRTFTEIQTKLYKANEKLNEFKTIIDKYVITALVDYDNKIIEVSHAFEKLSGYSKDELIGQSMSVLKHSKQEKKIIENLWDTISSKRIWSGIIRNKKKCGEEFWLEQTIIPKIDKETKLIESFLTIGIDITAKKELEKMASIDNLTKIYNRRMLDNFLEVEIEIANRHKEELSLIMMDIDYFKSVNDTYGHYIGDLLLIEISRLISRNLRTSDIFGRYGGEEFLIICNKTTKNNAYILAEKLRILIENHQFEEVGEKTISIGISTLEENDNKESLFKKADIALYEAKNSGKNRTIIYKR
jgi:diguanylate cyclase (GGDEF)-like protein/PAS domain S-box-containing protein